MGKLSKEKLHKIILRQMVCLIRPTTAGWIIIPLLVWILIIPVATSLSNENDFAYSKPTRSLSIKLSGNEVNQEIDLYSGSHALLIGMSDYTAGWPDLESIPAELAEVSKLLNTHGFHVEKHLNLSSSKLKLVYQKFIDNYGYKSGNRLLLFYSGHGHTRLGGRKGYIVPVDAPNPQLQEEEFLKRSLGMTQILAWARDIEAKHALFLFDSCFSGTIFKQKALPKRPKHISKATTLPVRQFITAGSAGETVPANSIFNAVFIDALKFRWGDLNGDGYVSGTELGLYLQEKVPQHTSQTPQYGKINDYHLSRGDFIFSVGQKEEPEKKLATLPKKKQETVPKRLPMKIHPEEVKADQYYLAGKKYAMEGDFNKALKYFEDAVALKMPLPNKFNYHYGLTLYKTGNYKSAPKVLEKYLVQAGRQERYYQPALELLVEMENIDSSSTDSTEFLLVQKTKIQGKTKALEKAPKEKALTMDAIRKFARSFPPKYTIVEGFRSYDIKWVATPIDACRLSYKRRESSHGLALFDIIQRPSEETTTFERVADFSIRDLIIQEGVKRVILGDASLRFDNHYKTKEFFERAQKIRDYCSNK